MNGWTLAELAELASRALAHDQVRVASGRVTEVPDPRLIRWYTTIGLLDRPTIGPGRLARYGMRHLLQVVAIKRLQAQGLALAQIQHRLAGATDDRLRAIAALPAGLSGDPAGPLPPVADRRAAAARATDRTAAAGEAERTAPAAAPERTAAAEVPERTAAGAESRFWRAGPAVDGGRDTVARVHGVRLGGLTLLLPVEPEPHDLDDIAVAARPLLDLLAARGWLDPTEGAQR